MRGICKCGLVRELLRLLSCAPVPKAGVEQKGGEIPRMSKRRDITCNDCYFRREGLCAIPGETPCPTFRAVSRGSLVPPQQPRLVPRPLGAVAAQAAAA